MTPEQHKDPALSAEKIKVYVRRETSLSRRVVNTLLLLLDVGMVVLIAALWSTEPYLPLRTHIAFGAMLAIGLAWMAFFLWVLVQRRPLFALDRVIAGRLALVFTTVFLAGGVAIAGQRGGWPAVLPVTVVGGLFVAAAGLTLSRALTARRGLLQRLDTLAAGRGA